MNSFKAAAASLLFLALGAMATQDDANIRPVHVDMMESCHKGLVIWFPSKASPKCGSFQTPQVKIFDSAGKLRFSGTGFDALKWAKSGMPSAPIPASVVVRDAASEARVTHVVAPLPGHGWVTFYIGKPCPPCETQLTTFRTDVMPKLDRSTSLSVFELW
jgi:hypothetical protein